MRFFIDELEVFFPYEFIYNEQLEYMKELKLTLDQKQHAIIEMPTGTGKTISLLALFVSYIIAYPEKYSKLIYCTRTVAEMEKTLAELKLLIMEREIDYQEKTKILALGLTSRRNLCIHPEIQQYKEREKVDSECRKRTAEWIRQSASDNSNLCDYFEEFDEKFENIELINGVYTLEDLKVFGKSTNLCPYYLARKLLSSANIVVYNYLYFLDQNIFGIVSKEIASNSIIVFDEAHNIDDVCIEAMTVRINRYVLDGSINNIEKLKYQVDTIKTEDITKLNLEYNTLLKSNQGLSSKGILVNDNIDNNIAIPEQIAKEAIPGNIRQSSHFINILKMLVVYLRNQLKSPEVRKISTTTFLQEIQNSNHIDERTLQFLSSRLSQLLTQLRITDIYEYQSVITMTRFLTSVSTAAVESFVLIKEPYSGSYSQMQPWLINQVVGGTMGANQLSLCCLDSSLALNPVLNKFSSVILTSGTMTPIDMYLRMLGIKSPRIKSIQISMPRDQITPLIVTHSSDQTMLTSSFAERANKDVVRNYGKLILLLASVVPDGIVCFFPSYRYLEEVIAEWNAMEVLDDLAKYKLAFIEEKDVKATSLSMKHFRIACDCGRGAIFFCVARGKVAEGVDFEGHYGRCVVMFGVPFQYTKSRSLLARLEFLNTYKNIKESEFLIFDAMRQCAQCLGRVIRKKNDYGLMIFADKRFSKADKLDKLPNWIKLQIQSFHQNLSTDQAMLIAQEFFKKMAQPFEIDNKYFHNQESFKTLQGQKE